MYRDSGSSQRIAILGAGAMGSVYAALFAEAGHHVWAVDVWQDHVDAINASGLRVEGASGDRTVNSVKAVTSLDTAPACDVYIIATKADGVAEAAMGISRHMPDHALVLTIQNGLGAGERIAEHMPTERVLLGVAEGFGASMRGPGHAHHNAMKAIRIGEMQGGETDRLAQLVDLWRGAGFEAHGYGDIQQLIWEKFLCNCTFSAPCTVFDVTIGEIMAHPERWAIACGCAREIDALAQAQKINVSYKDPIAYVTAFGERMPHARPSMLLDHHNRRRSEIDAINGMASVVGARLDIATPYNEALSAVVRRMEEAFS